MSDDALSSTIFDHPDVYRSYMTVGAKEVIGNLTLGAALTIAQLFAWAIARRRGLRG
jgi:hypothetical protein